MKRYLALAAIMMFTVPALADDGALFRRDVSKTPDLHTEHASMKMISQYVPAQTSGGTLLENIEYIDTEENIVVSLTRSDAKPLIVFYQDGHVDFPPDSGGFGGHGHRDIFGAVSLDDGATWKRTNLSKSGDLSSFKLKDGTDYPGDVVRLFDDVAGNKVLAVWASRYCKGGSPNFAIDDTYKSLVETELGYTTDADKATNLYLNDFFGVSGSQKSSDFADEGYPTVGEVPFSCLWAARGTLETVNEDGSFDPNGTLKGIVWRQAERLTSGVRDVHRMEAAAVPGAGFVVTWQEDPEGMRPGDGEGPGEGWSGAVAHHQTDIWYSYIAWDHFDKIVKSDGTIGILEDIIGEGGTPAVGVPLSMPVRLTDNAMCKTTGPGVLPTFDQYGIPEIADGSAFDHPYCYMDFSDEDTTPDLCAETRTVKIITPVDLDGTDTELCVAQDNRILRGNTAATRARTNLRGYDSDGDGVNDSAWVITAYEESKGLGEDIYDATGVGDPKMDMGKNIWYHTFDMFGPELVSQGMILNPPAEYAPDFEFTNGLDEALVPEDVTIYDAPGSRYMIIDVDPIYEDTEIISTPIPTILYQTEIARRFSLISQPVAKVGPSRTVAFTTWKQGIKRQGGPADVMARRFVVPEEFDPLINNPYDYANMVCAADNKQFTDGTNPRYVKGLCMERAINMSATTILGADTCDDQVDCEEDWPWNYRFDDIDMTLAPDGLAKIDNWVQCGPGFGSNTELPVGCNELPSTIDTDNFNDRSWDNPYDVAKGHRGYIDGDFIMVLYAWSPNWQANTVGHDNYNLYIRRSFDGGQTWTTTPDTTSSWITDPMPSGYTVDLVANGTTTCEWYGPNNAQEEVCTTYNAGDFEQARNVSQLVGTSETVLDPRYSQTRASITQEDGSFLYSDDERDPSKFFVVFETGDNTTVLEGEAEPLDLYYSRAANWGDYYDLVDTNEDDSVEPTDEDQEVGEYFDWLEGSSKYLSGEASVTANPAGTFFYAVWNQEEVKKNGTVVGSDAWFRRVMYLDESTVTPPSGDDPPTEPPKNKKNK